MILIIILIAIIGLWIAGGQWSGRIRDVGVPILLGIALFLKGASWWIALLCIGTYNIIRLGYGNKDPDDDKPSFLATIIPDYEGYWIRAVWGLLASSIGVLPLILTHSIWIGAYITYIIINVIINFCVSKFRLSVFPTDTLVSIGIGLIVFVRIVH